MVHAADEPNQTVPPPKRLVVPKLQGKISVDGKLDEPVWRQATLVESFVPNNGKGTEREGTQLRAWYDDEALYLGWTCRDSDIQATFTQRDSHFWEEEVAEFFITPGPLTKYFELQWNPLGGVFDAIIHNQLDEHGKSTGFKGEWGYTATGMKSAVIADGTVSNSEDKDRQWQVEVRVPFSDLNQPTPKPRDVWRGNFYRFNRAKGQSAELLSWTPTLAPSFHQPSRFGYIEFGN